jgi:hypothetical protein
MLVKLLQPLLLILSYINTQLLPPSQTTLACPFASTFDILFVTPYNQNNMKTCQTSSFFVFPLLYSVLYIKRSPTLGVCNPLINAVAVFSSAICIIDIHWSTSLIVLQILQSLVLLLDIAL